MTVEEIRERVTVIEQMKGDNEIAHGAEDQLYMDVLIDIANGDCIDPADCADAAIKAAGIEFDRWYA